MPLASVLQTASLALVLAFVVVLRQGRSLEALRELRTLLVSIHVRCDPRCCARLLSCLSESVLSGTNKVFAATLDAAEATMA